MMPRHRALLDLALKTVADNEFVAGAPFLDKTRDFRKVVAAVCVTQNNEVPRSLFNPLTQRASVSLDAGMRHARAMLFCYRDRAVGRSVIRDHNLSQNSVIAKRRQRLVNAKPYRLRLIQGRDHHRDGRRIGHRGSLSGYSRGRIAIDGRAHRLSRMLRATCCSYSSTSPVAAAP